MTTDTHESIARLIERFMQGATTLEEEARLTDYFRSAKEVPAEWQDYQEMFVWFGNRMQSPLAVTGPLQAKTPDTGRHRMWKWLAAAACLTAFVGLTALLRHNDNKPLALQTQPSDVPIPVIPKPPTTPPAVADHPSHPRTAVLSSTSHPSAPPAPIPQESAGKQHATAKKSLPPATPTENETDTELQRQQEAIEQAIAEARFQVFNASMQARGYQTVYCEDGTIEYRPLSFNPQNIKEI